MLPHPLNPPCAAKFVLFHNSTPGSAEVAFIEQVVAMMPHETVVDWLVWGRSAK